GHVVGSCGARSQADLRIGIRAGPAPPLISAAYVTVPLYLPYIIGLSFISNSYAPVRTFGPRRRNGNERHPAHCCSAARDDRSEDAEMGLAAFGGARRVRGSAHAQGDS